MSITLPPPPITAAELECLDTSLRLDLIRGELHPMPPMPGEEHGDITNLFSVLAGSHVLEHRLGKCFAAETRFVIEHNPDTAIGPDWAFVVAGRLPAQRSKGFVPLVPDAVLEVRSPSDSGRAVAAKVQQWLNAGVRVVLELNPAPQILTVYRPNTPPHPLGIEDTLSLEDVLPGFRLPIRRLFEDTEEQSQSI